MIAAPQKAKGPARTAILPSRGSTNPAKDMDMNARSSNTAAGPSTTGKKTDADINMESILHDIHNMADVSASLLENAVGCSHQSAAGHPNTYYLTKRQVERMLFSAYKATEMARDAIDAYLASVERRAS